MNKKIILIAAAVIFLLAGFSIHAQANNENLIQMAILLDTSNSMDGLIDQAKTQLWKIVNELALSKKNGKVPKLEVALYEYGKNAIPSQNGYMRMIVALTSDLDKISDELFKLTTDGGDEYCGMVIQKAAKELTWSTNNNVLKVIFIAGNEPFTQGNVDYKASCKAAITKGIIVNTIFCGSLDEGINTKWKDGADIADGSFMNIDQNKQAVYIEAPQDKKIVELGDELNRTYIAYGVSGSEKKEMQEKQDTNAKGANMESAVQRSAAKSSAAYENSSWDLVDAIKTKEVDVTKLDKKSLPAEMQGMNDKEKKEYIDKMGKKREELQNQITKLNDDRKKYIETKMKENSDTNTLDSAIIKTIRNQAIKKNFKF